MALYKTPESTAGGIEPQLFSLRGSVQQRTLITRQGAVQRCSDIDVQCHVQRPDDLATRDPEEVQVIADCGLGKAPGRQVL